MRYALLLLFLQCSQGIVFVDILKLSKMVLVDLFHAWEVFAPTEMGESIPQLPIVTREFKLMARMDEIARKVHSIEKSVRRNSRPAVRMIRDDMPSTIKQELRINQLMTNVAHIEEMFLTFKEYMQTGLSEEVNMTRVNENRREGRLESYTILNFAESAVSHGSSSVRACLNTIHNIVIQNSTTGQLLQRYGLFEEIRNLTENNPQICPHQQSPQQLMFHLYNAIQLAQLKAYTIIQFSWLFLRMYNKGNFSLESEMMRMKYIDKIAWQAHEVKTTMAKTRRDLWRCDPKPHVFNKTYVEITKLLQGFIVNEVDLNSELSCKEDCPFYKITKQHGCYGENYCAKQRPCRGKIISCKFVDSDMWICPSEGRSSRRYEWIEYENGRTLGEKKSCSRAITKVDSWWRWLFWHCSYCMCLCDDPVSSGTDRFFNLRPSVSDKANNRVITGLRFRKHRKVIHLQIQEGQMLPKALINESTLNWKNVEDYEPRTALEGVDFHMLSWEKRGMDLDDLKVPPGMVLTGIRFRMLGSHLNLEIQASMFNFTTGMLINLNNSQWIGNDNTDGSLIKPRTKLVLEDLDLPTRAPQSLGPDSKGDQYFEFTNSDMELDAAQSTIPFIDIQPVNPIPSSPLCGAGIYHKGWRDYGGFIAPKVFTMDYTSHIDYSLPEINQMHRKLR